MSLLPDYPFRYSYGPEDDRVNEFYVPALERCVQYHRKAGFFSSTALAIAAAGLAALCRSGGRMRFLCGAELAPEDVDAIRQGSDLARVVGDRMAGCLADPRDASKRARLEALAWLVGTGHLEIRVVLPRGRDGAPLPADAAGDYYHPKEGIFEDAEGNRLGFSGSSNETEQGWLHNYETFMVFATWPRRLPGEDEEIPPARAHIRSIAARFDDLWHDRLDSWIALPIPEAARRALLRYRPAEAPRRDPYERESLEVTVREPDPVADARAEEALERASFAFLRDAMRLGTLELPGVATALVEPWPHQLRVVRGTLEHWPSGFLFSDEVGLGKTIEVGLALRELVLRGEVKRALILAPKSVVRQWQEELYEKFVLDVPRLEGRTLVRVHGDEVPVPEGRNPWDAADLLLASSQLAKRRDRRDALLAAREWDLVIVDEAHHARRREFQSTEFRPNRLLQLLLGAGDRPGLRERARATWLLTATPMQIHPVETWDLLRVIGLGGRWGALDENFLRFFEELRLPFRERNWEFLLAMVRDHLELSDGIDPRFERDARQELGPVEWARLRELLLFPGPAVGDRVRKLPAESRRVLDALVRHHTPLRTMLWRNTRELLRRYREQGLLDRNIPVRRPENHWIELRPEEQALYDRIEEYISEVYRRYQEERRGLGFVMTVYRRRLTSSFAAIRKSLERRLALLEKQLRPDELLTDEDLEEADLERDMEDLLAEAPGEIARAAIEDEARYLRGFLDDLEALPGDSKLEKLQEDLREIFQQRDKVIIFTQYTDTMDALRDRLVQVYGSRVACYSGRGGEAFENGAWVQRPKEEIKTRFGAGGDLSILLCTRSASEGLNLQDCGVLINYDMPWNPMEVEQRIGRIDRIGQKHDEVWIRNYFYDGTVEAEIYRRLEDRIEWFQQVVGQLQPILHAVAPAIEKLAMASRAERGPLLDEEVRRFEEMLARRDETPDLDEFVDRSLEPPPRLAPPAAPPEIEETVVSSRRWRDRLQRADKPGGSWVLRRADEEVAITFDPAVFADHPDSLRLLTWGERLFGELVEAVPQPAPAPREAARVAVVRGGDPPLVLYLAADGKGRPRGLRTLGELRAALREGSPLPEGFEELARKELLRALGERREKERRLAERRERGHRQALVERARVDLRRAAACLRALVDETWPPPPGNDDEDRLIVSDKDIDRLVRHGNGIPWRGLRHLLVDRLGEHDLAGPLDDTWARRLRGASPATLEGLLGHLVQEGTRLATELKALLERPSTEPAPPPAAPSVLLLGTEG